MTNEQKAQMYNQLMFEHTKLQNQISSIKGESIDLNSDQLRRIKLIEDRLREINYRVSRMPI